MEPWQILTTIGIIALIVEVFTAGFIFGSIGIGFFMSAIANAIGLPVWIQILFFAVGVAFSFFFIRPFITKVGYKKHLDHATNQNALIGRHGIVTEEINNEKHTGRIAIDGDSWRVQSIDSKVIKEDSLVAVVGIKSTILIVKTLN